MRRAHHVVIVTALALQCAACDPILELCVTVTRCTDDEPLVGVKVKFEGGETVQSEPNGRACWVTAGASDEETFTTEKPCYQSQTFGPFDVPDRQNLDVEVCIEPVPCSPQDAGAG